MPREYSPSPHKFLNRFSIFSRMALETVGGGTTAHSCSPLATGHCLRCLHYTSRSPIIPWVNSNIINEINDIYSDFLLNLREHSRTYSSMDSTGNGSHRPNDQYMCWTETIKEPWIFYILQECFIDTIRKNCTQLLPFQTAAFDLISFLEISADSIMAN